MKTGCRGCGTAFVHCIYGLVAFVVRKLFFNIMGKRHFAKFVKNIFKNTVICKFYSPVSTVMVGWFFSALVALPCGMLMAGSKSFTTLIQPVIEFVRYLQTAAGKMMFAKLTTPKAAKKTTKRKNQKHRR